MKRILITGLLTLGFISAGVHAHGNAHGNKEKQDSATVEEKAFGRPGDARRVTRTVHVEMDDTMHYSVDEVTVKQGETIRFVATNRGVLMHEMVLGTLEDIEEHAELMRKFPDMQHDEEYQLHVKPGTTGQMIWHFTNAGVFKFACLMPGHYEAGMHGNVVVRTDAETRKLSERSGSNGRGS